MIKIDTRVTGGHNLQKSLDGLGKGGVDKIAVGFFATSRYPDGTPVATVAAWNEFGTRKQDGSVHVPERPFMRQAVANAEKGVADIAAAGLGGRKLVMDRQTAELIGVYVQGQIQERIRDLKDPPNAPATIEAKGDDNPLIDNGDMRRSVTYEVT